MPPTVTSLHAEIVERTEKVLLKRRAQADLVGDVVVEECVDVRAVGPVGTCRHAEPELRLEVRHDLLVALGRCAVHLVDDDHVERLRIQRAEHAFSRKRLHGREDAIRARLVLPAAEKPVGEFVLTQTRLKLAHRLPRYLLAVHDEEHPAGLELTHGEGRGIGLARAVAEMSSARRSPEPRS